MTARLWLILLLLWGCAKAREPEAEPPRTKAVTASSDDVAARRWLETVRAAHAKADAAVSQADKDVALSGLRAAIASTLPDAVAQNDADRARKSLYAHAARLALDLDRTADANALIREGLALRGTDPFRSQLLLLDVETQRALGHRAAEAAAVEAARRDLALE